MCNIWAFMYKKQIIQDNKIFEIIDTFFFTTMCLL